MIYNPNFYQLRETMLERMLIVTRQNINAESNGVIFFGDSNMELYDIDRYFPEIEVKYNCGIGGSTSESLIWIVDEAVIKYKPKVVVFMVGTNDLGNTNMRSPREIALNVRTIIDLIKKNIPHVKILIVSTLPCNEELQGEAVGKFMRSNKNILILNEEYKEIIKNTEDTIFVDAFSKLIDDDTNNIKYGYSEDGLHLTQIGYEHLTEIIKPYINKSM